MGSAKKIAKGVAWTSLATTIKGIYGFVSVPILIAHFGKSDYGLIGLAMSVNVYLRLMDMGLTSTSVRFFSNWIAKGDKGKVSRLFGTNLTFYGTIGLINALILVAISVFCGNIFNVEADQVQILRGLLYILAISAFVSWFTSCFDQLIKGNEEVGWTQRMSLLPTASQIVVLILTIWFSYNITLYYALTAFSMFLIVPFMVSKIKKLCPYISFLPSFDKSIFKEILPYCINIFSFSIFQFSVNNLRPVFLGMQGTTEDIADYRILNGIISMVLMLGGMFVGVLLPSASKAVALHNTRSQEHIAYQGTKYITIAIAFCCFGVISVSKELLVAYVGEDYVYLTIWLNIWLLCTLCSHNQAISSLILSGSDIRAITYSTIAASSVGLLLCWFLIPAYSIGGTVIGYAAYMLIQIAFYYIYYWPRKMNLDSWKIFTSSFIPPVLVGLTCVGILQFVHIGAGKWIPLLSKGMLFALMFFAGTIMILNKEDRLFFLGFVKKQKR